MAFSFIPGTHDRLADAYATEMDFSDDVTGLCGEVRDWNSYIHIYHDTGKIAGTLSRPTYWERMRGNYMWRVTLPDGTSLGEAIGPRSAFVRLRRHYRVAQGHYPLGLAI